jgi:hypothetical protein
LKGLLAGSIPRPLNLLHGRNGGTNLLVNLCARDLRLNLFLRVSP